MYDSWLKQPIRVSVYMFLDKVWLFYLKSHEMLLSIYHPDQIAGIAIRDDYDHEFLSLFYTTSEENCIEKKSLKF